ncbi:M20 metallopeptidase family protein [Goodfellowiella coeruleoviolacea]|uniref:Hippurate hydrolase n=1 Tax=Goodfellowiella coeruleoviolacea TaxID=334858 RepID=A0AAE3KGY3_9PSEU|nr:M20 family metallopeptidase [Goodfellowiella coeruleoviolacea]MCP2166715.1 hippurate hydrolase [Goodfellowiella coeruleoviolacea]
MTVREDAAALRDELVALRRALHADPEVGLHLPRTRDRVLAAVDGLGLEVRTGSAVTSVTGVLRGGRPGPTVLLRGDMDALPMRENTGLPFASRTGDTMHACGHDLHTAMLVGAARLLAARRAELAGDVVFMFQPGEEGWNGAQHMIDEGLFEASGSKPVAAYALHVRSAGLASGVFSARAGTMLSAADGLHVVVRGRGGHGSQPHLAKDPVPVACEMVLALESALTRAINVFDPVVLTVGNFHAGTQRNIIPDTARFEATVRSFSPQAQARIEEVAVEVCRGVAAAHGVEVDVEYRREFPMTINDDVEAEFAASTVREVFGEQHYQPLDQPWQASEDFSLVLNEVPGAFVFLGACPPGLDPATAPNNHSPVVDFDESVLPEGAALLAELAIRRLAAER